jgi:uncharacterized protein YbaA (DUF1428 family)
MDIDNLYEELIGLDEIAGELDDETNRRVGARRAELVRQIKEIEMTKYNKDAVEKAIKKDPRIKGKEAKMIHALLKGRSK